MDAEYANYYTREVMLILIREFQSPDEEMKKIVLKVVKQCCATDGVEPQYIKDEVLPPFFKHFWNQRMALDRRNYRQVSLVNVTGTTNYCDSTIEVILYRKHDEFCSVHSDCCADVASASGICHPVM